MFPWFLRGSVIHGFGRGGSQLGFPTANLELNPEIITQLLPFKETVLYGWGCIEPQELHGGESSSNNDSDFSGVFPFAMSVGTNPHFKNAHVSVEPHFIHQFPKDFYGSVVRIVVLGKIRDSVPFQTIELLIEKINEDISRALIALECPANSSWKSHHLLNHPMSRFDSLPDFKYLNE